LGHLCSFDSGAGLPSWTQDWTSRAPIPLRRLGHHNRERDFYDSSLGSTVKFRFRKDVEGPQLIVTGFIVDQLWSVGPAHAFANDHRWPETTPLSVRNEAIAEMSNRIGVEWRRMLESHYSPEKMTEQNFQKQLEGDEENEVDKTRVPIYSPTNEDVHNAIEKTLHGDFIIVDYENYGRMSHDQHMWEEFLKNPSQYSNSARN
jgi:hypothetical protein